MIKNKNKNSRRRQKTALQAESGDFLFNVIIADTFFKRLKGLMFKKQLPPESAYFFPGTSSIHMFFMKFPIDVIYARMLSRGEDNTRLRVVKTVENLKPRRISSCPSAGCLLEAPAGSCSLKKISVNDILILSCR